MYIFVKIAETEKRWYFYPVKEIDLAVLGEIRELWSSFSKEKEIEVGIRRITFDEISMNMLQSVLPQEAKKLGWHWQMGFGQKMVALFFYVPFCARDNFLLHFKELLQVLKEGE